MCAAPSHPLSDLTAESHGVLRTRELRAFGMSKRQIAQAVTGGALVPLRRGSYLVGEAGAGTVEAASAGGRLACVSLLRTLGIFVLAASQTHIHFERSSRTHRRGTRHQVWHWTPLLRTPHPHDPQVHVLDALAQATACQQPRAAVATLDSAVHAGLVSVDDLDEVFARVPPRRRVLQRFVDGRAESGPETLLRLIALALGFEVEIQVVVPGVGRVDLILDGWIAVECDSELHHSGWAAQRKDRRRDLALAALGYSTIRPIAEDIMYHPEVVVAALRGLQARRPFGGTGVN